MDYGVLGTIIGSAIAAFVAIAGTIHYVRELKEQHREKLASDFLNQFMEICALKEAWILMDSTGKPGIRLCQSIEILPLLLELDLMVNCFLRKDLTTNYFRK